MIDKHNRGDGTGGKVMVLSKITEEERQELPHMPARPRVEAALELLVGIQDPKAVAGARSLLRSALKKL